ncbi:MAG: HD domain-containing protein [Clostridia bacterium]|nr:HD domain-containing protein [Clostridia bacterium]
MKEEFINLLKSINREGMDKLLEFLEGTDFFDAPASTRYHGAWKGGLLAHSMKVYEILKTKTEDSDAVKIVALLHDICKTNFYKTDYRNVKNNGVWEQVPYYTVEDNIPYGHGEKSVMMVSEFIKLTPEEKYAIRWHMGFTEPKELYGTLGQAYKKYPLALLAFEADLEATYFYDI